MNINDFNEDHLDHEVQMAKADLLELAKNAVETYKLLAQHYSEERGLPGWVQSKVTKADDYMRSVRKHIEHKEKDIC